jgi:hypothetical protein
VRATEALAKKPARASGAGGSSASSGSAGGSATDENGRNGTASGAVPVPSANVRDLEARLQRALGTRVRVIENAAQKGQGHLEIHYHSLEELDRLLDRLLST